MRPYARNAFRPLYETAAHIRPVHSFRGGHARLSTRTAPAIETPVQVQSVRFKRPPFFNRQRLIRFITWTATTYILLGIASRQLGISIEIEEVENSKDGKKRAGSGIEVTDDDEDDDEELLEDGDFFIPLTRAVKLPRTWYKGSDPEWQEYVRIAKDEERRNRLCDRMKHDVMLSFNKRVPMARLLGSDIAPGKHWIDFSFPEGPPPDHEREGLLIGGGRITWVSEIVDDGTHQRQSRLIWPEDTVKAGFRTGKTALLMLYRGCMLSLGLATPHNGLLSEGWGKIEAYVKLVRSDPGAIRFRAGMERRGKWPPPEPPQSAPRHWIVSMLVPSAWSFQRLLAEETLSGTLCRSLLFMRTEFLSNFAHVRDARKQLPPRGSVVMLGLVEMRGSKGRLVLDTYALYDPKTDQFLLMKAALKSYKPWSQNPRGGP